MNASNKVNNDDDGDDGRMRFFWMCFAGAQSELVLHLTLIPAKH